VQRRTFLRQTTGAALATLAPVLRGAGAERPNILLILADDLGFSDLGCYGGEIETPNLDKLAKGGVRFTQFYNSARCCPSRSALMTGLHPHQTGIGNMTGAKQDPEKFPGYTGQMNSRNVTIPEVLRTAGYSTYMAGKWHLGQPGPVARGFDEYYGMLHGFDSSWEPKVQTRLPEGRPVRTYKEGEFYSTNAITDHTLDFLSASRTRKQPFFFYLAYNAAHFPLHAPKDVIDKYIPVYERGWDVIREERQARLRKMGLFGQKWEMTPRSIIGPNRVSNIKGTANDQNPAWSSLDKDRQKDLARRMATFAAMVDVMDRNIGRIIDDLKANGQLDNTLILFLSDNGACAEWEPFGFDGRSGPDNILHKGEQLAGMGQRGTYHSYGSAWANASNTPFRMYKHYAHEGGICTPLIAHWPAGLKRAGTFDHTPGHIIDMMPTCVELAGAKYPTEHHGAAIPPMEGKSLTPVFAGKRIEREAFYWEHEGNRAVRVGSWKAVALTAGGAWSLYNLDEDRTEMHDLAAQYPERVKSMVAQWERWARRTNVIPWIWTPAYAG
jgi:arylsulfatase